MRDYLFATLLIAIILTLGCSGYRFSEPDYIDTDKEITSIYNTQDTFIYYRRDPFLGRDYSIGRRHAFFLYQKDGRYFIEYYKRRSRETKSLTKPIKYTRLVRSKTEVPALDSVFKFISANRIDTVRSFPILTSGCDHCPITLVYINHGPDSIKFFYDMYAFHLDTTHVRYKLVNMISNTIRNHVPLPTHE